MPKRKDISSILIVGAGPIIIGQACEFDYSGTQACKALKEEGYKVILLNSNPATIMTDPELADSTYIEPITTKTLEKIIKYERPDALLPTMGGQTALNVALSLEKESILKKFNVELIGASKIAIETAEDRKLFREAMDELNIESPKSVIANNIKEAKKNLKNIGLPAIIRPAFTMGGTGGGIAYTEKEYIDICKIGLKSSPVNQILIDESLIGWKEFEMEVIRDKADNSIIVCSIENVDPMGIHTGDSITVAPALTLSDKEYQKMRSLSIQILKKIGVETGGSNVQWAINPSNGKMIVIEMNPRVSRSSALASKATGFPIAKVAAKLAIGYTLDELKNDITEITPASFEPTIDYIVTKIPRFAFEKFVGSEVILSTSMKSVGEAMAIGGSIYESLQKAISSLEMGYSGFDNIDFSKMKKSEIIELLSLPKPDRILSIVEAIRVGISKDEINLTTKLDPWFLNRLEEIALKEVEIKDNNSLSSYEKIKSFKIMGFTDKKIASILNKKEIEIRKIRHDLNVHPVYKTIDTCAAEFDAKTPYMYSTYEPSYSKKNECESKPTKKEKVIILGGGPNRIGQGIEFDYCCCHACYSLSELGFETIMINCNPETVSTDYDTSDRLYFEPLTTESVLEIIKKEGENGKIKGVIVQFGGQTPLNIAKEIENENINILGTSPASIDMAEDREQFQQVIKKLGLKQPKNGIAYSKKQALDIVDIIGYPVVIRPSYVLGGRAMEIIRDQSELLRYIDDAIEVSGLNPVLIDNYLSNAIEVDIDAICDGSNVFVAGVMEHIEEAGVHSGDSACSLPPYSLSKNIIDLLKKQTKILAKELNVVGLMNIQFAIKNNEVFILEVNPRASRTVPFVSKATGIGLTKIATQLMVGKSLDDFKLNESKLNYFSIKEAVLPFDRFPGVDTILSPEMRSTGEVMGIAESFGLAFYKAQLGAGITLPTTGNIFVSVKEKDKNEKILKALNILSKLGFSIIATTGTCNYLIDNGIIAQRVKKVSEGSPNITDLLKKEKISLLFNTTEGSQSIKDSKEIRSIALKNKIPYYTTITGCWAASEAIKEISSSDFDVKSIQEIHKFNKQ
tara:strand:+ start:1775 stop:5020 length:3246 start_codon:yes stop_codon:yes gene_type:complete